MKNTALALGLVMLLAGCFNSSNPPQPPRTTIVVPPSAQTVVVCSDGTAPPCH
jgi:PBP1b-binding outer membrane lipoprotein LpoB